VPYHKKPDFVDDPLASQGVVAPRADPNGRTLPDIYEGFSVFVEEHGSGGDEERDDDQDEEAQEATPGAMTAPAMFASTLAGTAATMASRASRASRASLAFVDDVDARSSGSWLGPSVFRKRRSSSSLAGPPEPLNLPDEDDDGDGDGAVTATTAAFIAQQQQQQQRRQQRPYRTGREAVEVDATRPADVATFNTLIEMEASMAGEDECCIVCPSDVYVSHVPESAWEKSSARARFCVARPRTTCVMCFVVPQFSHQRPNARRRRRRRRRRPSLCPDSYMSAEGGSLQDKPFSEPTSEQARHVSLADCIHVPSWEHSPCRAAQDGTHVA
jgi:hypothetical protein